MSESQNIVRKIETEKGPVFFILPADLPLGTYHDVLISERGWVISKMMEAYQAQEAEKVQETPFAAEPTPDEAL
jgi:hypothetical protein